jgi:hypothetical protein
MPLADYWSSSRLPADHRPVRGFRCGVCSRSGEGVLLAHTFPGYLGFFFSYIRGDRMSGLR